MKKTTTIDIDTQTITVTCSVKRAETDATAQDCAWTFAMDTFTTEDVWKLAAKSLVIQAQALYRNGNMDHHQVVTKDLLTVERKRGPVDKKAQAAKFLDSMTPEVRNEFLKENGLI